jgi:hypothetical protein
VHHHVKHGLAAFALALVSWAGPGLLRWRPDLGVNRQAWFRFLGEITRWLGQFRGPRRPGSWLLGWPALAAWFEQGMAQVLEQPQAVGGHGEAAPAGGGTLGHGPHQGEATGLAGSRPTTLTLLRSLNVLSMRLECWTPLMVLGGELRVGG